MADLDKLYFDGNGFESDCESTHNRFGLKNIFNDIVSWDDMYDNLWDDELWEDQDSPKNKLSVTKIEH